jgi:hypothetical protein
MRAAPVVFLLALVIGQAPATSPVTDDPLDYAFFKARVEPIFLAKRPGHARCYVCHRGVGAPTYLQVLSPGVVPGHPELSRLLIHPLAEEAGGDDFHGGGRQFASKTTREWQTIAAWIRGERLK